MSTFTWWKSKTFWGAVAGSAAWVLKQPELDVITIIQGVAGLLTVIGVRDGIAKATK